ncbi:hypothetical protein VMCG_01125 [Cytospora schulzeri]|uniref:Uncharacterized protein n=1 Tax=Cytospora schulzeri TaxID=448051 RepID=A0A423X6B7_9PEZI|nr:hypothetical protein VMCG_01125 [Valsa malicola]
MPLPHNSDNYSLECPTGYQYYTCATSSFEGCCSIDACEVLPGACPIQNQPGFQTSPGSMTSIISFAVPDLTPSSAITTTAVVPETISFEPAIATTSNATSSTQLPAYSASSAPTTPTHPKFNHAGLIAGLVVSFSAVLIATSIMLWRLWRRRHIRKDGDDVPFQLLRRLRNGATAPGSAAPGPPDRNKPVPPVPTSITMAGLLDQQGDDDGQRGPTDPNTPTSTAGATTLRQPSIRAVPFSPSRPGAASMSSRSDGGGGGGGGTGVVSTPRRAASPGDSFFDSLPGRRGSGLDSTWMDAGPGYAELRSPCEFHGLSAPPRSRDGSRPGSKGTQAV